MTTSTDQPNPTDTLPADFDAKAMNERYRVEREKRLRPDGNDQYIEVVDQFSHYLDDPYVETRVEREPLTDEVEVVLIGGGFGGL